MKSVLNIHWKDWCWSWKSNTLATRWEELTHWERPWCWEKRKAGGEKDNRGWDGWMASPTWWTWVWASSGSWWWTGKPGVLQSMGSQKVRHDWATELMRWQISLHTHAHNWTFVLTILERNPNLNTLYWISMYFGMSTLMQSTTVKSTHELVC